MHLTNTQNYTASDARDNLYTLIRNASSGLTNYEITLRGNDPVMLINKAEFESWQETLDILSNKPEITAIRQARKETKNLSHRQVLTSLGLAAK